MRFNIVYTSNLCEELLENLFNEDLIFCAWYKARNVIDLRKTD